MKAVKVCLGIGLLIVIAACKKALVDAATPVSPVTGTRTQFTLDSVYLYAKQIYLWNDALPAYGTFNPRVKYASYPSATDAFHAELYDISQMAINPVTGLVYETPVNAGEAKYSYLQTGSTTGTIAAVIGTQLPAILKDTVIQTGTNNIAYIALGSFPELSTCKEALDAAFSRLAAVSPQQLVVDLRYNGGGFVETAEYVANLIAPSTLAGKVMFSERYNALLQASNADILKNQTYYDENGKTVSYKGRTANLADVDYTETGNTHKFNKQGGLETVKDIYFITSANTASASELLISSMKPYFNVKLVGGTTYGKPVGFFPVKIDVYSVYLSGFLIRNAQGWSDYFQGIPADVEVPPQEAPVLGDPQEACFNAVLSLINGTSLSALQQQANKKALQVNSAFKASAAGIVLKPAGMIEHRLKLKNN